MVDQRQLSICVPSWNRSDMTIESFYDVYEDERVSEIVIVDDASEMEIYEDLKSMADCLPKVKLYRNIFNKDCYFNKLTAISYSNNPFAILLDSDNKIDKSYLDRIFEIEEWDERTIYTPSFAAPNFDFRPYENLLVTKENVAEYVDKPMFQTCLNAANYFVSKDGYTSVWDNDTDPVTSDSIYIAYRWLESGRKIKIVSGLTYQHKVHEQSHYQNNIHRTPAGFHESILQKLRQLA